MPRWPLATLVLLLAAPPDQARAEAMPEPPPMQGPGFGCAAPFMLRAAVPRLATDTAVLPPIRHAMLACLSEPGGRKRPLRQT